MRVIISENKLSNAFSGLMDEYSDIEPILNWHEYIDNGQYLDQENIRVLLRRGTRL